MENTYPRRPLSLRHEEMDFHKRDPRTGIIIGAEPFFYPGPKGEAVLMLHGYTSTPRDLRELGQQINTLGYTVSGILLPGHGTKPTALDPVRWQDWYAAALAEFERLKKEAPQVHVVGFSMGGALAMHLAANVPVGKLVLLSPFFKIAYNKWHIVPEEWLVYTIGKLLRHLKKTHSGNCNDPVAREKHIAYYHYALSSINQALELVKVIRNELRLIKNPLLIVHAKGDKTTSPLASRRIFDLLTSDIKRFVWLRKSNHIITHDYDKEIVSREVLKFFRNAI
jgi:carboxylesterase